ncbi:hypothetical protein AVEN_150951-1 [Araneus ventricosus]|uniref:Endonuclease/exonuclease/phosphatase domain-containing protein n=1 Tax=Araneus ventricosus TaxID=182803 RepID=A0A4Y2RVE9_ARAVE|nr:hypothetical protein AVEN_150951-1 [Araneus ventricosus]
MLMIPEGQQNYIGSMSLYTLKKSKINRGSFLESPRSRTLIPVMHRECTLKARNRRTLFIFQLQKQIHKENEDFDNNRWRETIQGVNPEDNTLYDMNSKWSKKFIPTTPINDTDGRKYTPLGKANAFRYSLENSFQGKKEPYCDSHIIQGSNYINLDLRPPPSSDTSIFTFGIEGLLQISPNQILCGDYIAHHTSWGYNYDYPRGNSLKAFALQAGFETLALDTATRFGTNSANTIDFAIVKNFLYLYEIHSIPELSSDHNLIMLNFFLQYSIPNYPGKLKTNWKKSKDTLKNSEFINPHFVNTAEQLDSIVCKLALSTILTMDSSPGPGARCPVIKKSVSLKMK